MSGTEIFQQTQAFSAACAICSPFEGEGPFNSPVQLPSAFDRLQAVRITSLH